VAAATRPAGTGRPLTVGAVDNAMRRRLGWPILAMYAPYIVRRTQIYLDEEQDRRLAERARATGRTKSDLIREAVDRLLDEPVGEDEELARFRAAVDAAFGIAPYLEDGVAYVRKLRDIDRRRQERREREWHG
jgi:predicted DNA-binding protein